MYDKNECQLHVPNIDKLHLKNNVKMDFVFFFKLKLTCFPAQNEKRV